MNEQEIRARIEKEVSQQAEFIIHALTFALLNPVLWAFWYATRQWVAFPWPLLITLGWVLGLIAHGVETYKDRIVDYFTRRELRRMGVYDKPKRLSMTDDGELAGWDGTELLRRETEEA